jgi:archaetidylinositol phosphate synthase
MLDRLRSSLKGVLATTGRICAKVIPSPTAWTIIGVILAFLASFYYGGGNPIAGGVLLALSGILDVVDGAVARATNRVSERGAFLDSALDRVSEVVVYLGIAIGAYTSSYLVLLALSMSLLVSYARAKGDALGVSLAGIGIGERPERLIVLIVFSLVKFVGAGVAIVALLAIVTFVQRSVKVSNALGKRAKVAPV